MTDGPVPSHPGYLKGVEATHVQVKSAPGSVFILLQRRNPSLPAGAHPGRQSVAEVSVEEALVLYKRLGDHIIRAAELELSGTPGGPAASGRVDVAPWGWLPWKDGPAP